MSNIFYSNVDYNLRSELNARGKSGFRRNNQDLDFMLGKIANVELIAYDTGSSKAKESGRLGGRAIRDGRYLPNGKDGFLSKSTYTTSSIVYSYAGETVTKAALSTSDNITDTTNRIGPFITSLDVSIGDHSMGLLNKATINISIPNPQRDLDTIEDIWFRPGRYVKIEIHHPNSAIITYESGSGRLTENSLPNKESLKKRYPEWDVEELLKQINRMNVFSFEGLITSFDFSYTETGQVDASLSLTGTSNSYTDVSMYMQSADEKTDPKKKQTTYNPKTQGLNKEITTVEQQQAGTPPKSEFYDVLNEKLVEIVKESDPTLERTLLTKFKMASADNSAYTDHFVLVGEPYPPSVNDAGVNAEILSLTNPIASGEVTGSATASLQQRADFLKKAAADETDNKTHYNRYITLGALIYMTNTFITNKMNATEFTQVICDDTQCFSNYLPNLTSCTPDSVLLLPKSDTPGDMNYYGETIYYQTVADDSAKKGLAPWPGVYQTLSNTDSVVYPSRIFLNVEMIQEILNSISANDTRNYTLDTFLTSISAKINYATAGAINMHLVTHPTDQTKLLFTDVKYIKPAAPIDNEKKPQPVVPYSVPMMANHPYGTIVRGFKFSATLPESVKNLSYVLNQGDEITEQEIAPYMNYMYSTKNPEAINQFIADFKTKHEKYIEDLKTTRSKLGLSPREPQFVQAVYKALNNYIKYPTPDIKSSQVMVAPIYPFTVEFDMDGINGLRYGDVLTFNMLPLKYRVNTVFSVIGITHTVSSEGQWTTNVRCIMRPKID